MKFFQIFLLCFAVAQAQSLQELADKSPTVQRLLYIMDKAKTSTKRSVGLCYKSIKEYQYFDCHDEDISALEGFEDDFLSFKNIKIIPFLAEDIKLGSKEANTLLKGCAKLPFDEFYVRGFSAATVVIMLN